MNFYVFLKVFGDICLYFACIGAFPALFPYSFSALWPGVVCGAAAGTAAFLSDHGRSRGRFLCLALPLSCLALPGAVMEAMILLPPLAHVIVMICRDEWALEYFRFREVFRKTLKVLGIFLLVIFFGSMLEETTNERNPLLDSTAVLHFGLLYTASGILLQRQLRLGSDSAREKNMSNLQLVLTTGGTGLFLLAIIITERFLASQGISIFELIGQALRIAVAVPLSLLGMLVSLLLGVDGKVLQKIENSQGVETEPAPTDPLPEMGGAIMQQPRVEIGFPWWLAILILAAMTLILLYLTRQLRSRRMAAPARETIGQVLPKGGSKAGARRSNRSKLRKIYREFLKSEKGKGQKLESYHTSQNVLDDLCPGSDVDAAARLRQEYLRARYDLKHAVSPEQVAAAREAMKQYRDG